MDLNEAMERIDAAGWGDFSLWRLAPGKFMGRLRNPDCTENDATNLRDYAETAEDALRELVRKAVNHSPEEF